MAGLIAPAVDLQWSVLGFLHLCFFTYHLYNYDKFRSLKFWEVRNGAFKKLLSIAYMFTVPLMTAKNLICVTVKYQQGYVSVPGYGIIPKPSTMWPESAKRWMFPSDLCFAMGWSFEIVAHLEELCFWIFLTRKDPINWHWFHSTHFRVWVIGSIAAVALFPSIAIAYRHHARLDAIIMVMGGVSSGLLTIAFGYVLIIFPSFLNRIKSDGAATDVTRRLTKFNHLNVIRVVFRVFFFAPLLILGADGLTAKHPINSKEVVAELLAMLGALGCIISSMLTLVIFYPRHRLADKSDATIQMDNRVSMARFSPNRSGGEASAGTRHTGASPALTFRRDSFTSEFEDMPKPRPSELDDESESRIGHYRRTSLPSIILNYSSPMDIFDLKDPVDAPAASSAFDRTER